MGVTVEQYTNAGLLSKKGPAGASSGVIFICKLYKNLSGSLITRTLLRMYFS